MDVGFDHWLVKKILGRIVTKALRNKLGIRNSSVTFDSIRTEQAENNYILVHVDADLCIQEKDLMKMMEDKLGLGGWLTPTVKDGEMRLPEPEDD